MPFPSRRDISRGTGEAEVGSQVCALEMERSSRSLRDDSKLDYDVINRNCGVSAEVSMPQTLSGKRHVEGDNLYRLRNRKFLIEDKKRLCALALSTALLGILLMIIHAEICSYVLEPVGVTKLLSVISWEVDPVRLVDPVWKM